MEKESREPDGTPLMVQGRGYASKPGVIYLCAAVYAFCPLVDICFFILESGQGLNLFVKRFVELALVMKNPYYLAFLIVWGLCPLVVVGILSARPWGYLALACHLLVTALISFIDSSLRFSLGDLAFINMPFIVVTVFYLLSDIRLPYFYPRLRWWERVPRYSAPILVDISGEERLLFDISMRGVFVIDDQAGSRKLGDRLDMILHLGHHRTRAKVCLTRVHTGGGRYPKGFGAKFLSLSPEAKASMTEYISFLRLEQRERQRRGEDMGEI